MAKAKKSKSKAKKTTDESNTTTAQLSASKLCKVVPSDADDYCRVLWSVRLSGGVPILECYAVDSNGVDLGQLGVCLGEIKGVQLLDEKVSKRVTLSQSKRLSRCL